MLIYIRRWQQKLTPQPGANPLAVLLGWLLFGVFLLLALSLGLLFLLVGWILLLPLMWRRRRQMRQMWQFTKASRAAQQQARQRYQQQREQSSNRSDDNVIEGEYEVKDKDKN